MFVKRIDKTQYYDVFTGNTWDNWTRVRRNHWGVSYVAGQRLHKSFMQQLNDKFNITKGN